MSSNPLDLPVRSIVIPKQTLDYRIITDDPENWFLVANRSILRGEPVIREGEAFHLDVRDVEAVDIILEETQESKRVYTTISAVPNDMSCTQTALELPWCFTNHSCEANTHDRWQRDGGMSLSNAVTEATRDIAAGEELTYDYDLEHYDHESPIGDCKCGTASCRGASEDFVGC